MDTRRIITTEYNNNDIENNQKSLPPSPHWTLNMNPSLMPDGSLSDTKMIEFNHLLKNTYLKINYLGITRLESLVKISRTK